MRGSPSLSCVLRVSRHFSSFPPQGVGDGQLQLYRVPWQLWVPPSLLQDWDDSQGCAEHVEEEAEGHVFRVAGKGEVVKMGEAQRSHVERQAVGWAVGARSV